MSYEQKNQTSTIERLDDQRETAILTLLLLICIIGLLIPVAVNNAGVIRCAPYVLMGSLVFISLKINKMTNKIKAYEVRVAAGAGK